MAKRRQTRRMYRRSKKYSGKMRGGALDEQELLGLGFTAEHIAALHNYGFVSMNPILISLHTINPQTGAYFTPQELIDSLNDVNNEAENEAENEDDVQEGVNQPPPPEFNNIDNNDINNHMNFNNMNFEQGPGLDMQDLGPYSPQSVTEEPSGGRRIRKSRRRRSRNHKFRKSGRRMRSRKTYKGGACYGNGVGANAFDPNNSIYNTRELQLFPYKPN
jgi:hypothetical protein